MSDQDRNEIVQLINLYALAVDTQRWDLFDRIFTSDVYADFGGPTAWSDLATWKADFATFHDPFDSTQHGMWNHLVNFAGDTAQSMTYGNWRLIKRGTEGGDLWEGTGYYDDEWVRTDSGWRIKRRLARVIWWEGNALVNGFGAKSTALRREADAGTVNFVKAIQG